MIFNQILKVVALLAITAALFNFYTLSRFTVDDAFITWRYGRNLVEFGVWGYNPTNLDLTQAYTNPIFAALSILPAVLGMDAVLFFKFASILLIILFFYAVYKVSDDKISGITAALALFALPTTHIHIFSGLETFAYAAALGFSFICIDRERWAAAAILIMISMTSRPEAWLWSALLPLAYLITTDHIRSERFQLTFAEIFAKLKKGGFLLTLIPGIALLVMLTWHKLHFGYYLPNTFYVKSGHPTSISVRKLILFSACLLPMIVPIFLGRKKASIVILSFFAIVILQYSTSDLSMNYSQRFAYHIFGPTFIFATYTVAKNFRGHLAIELENRGEKRYSLKQILSIYLLLVAGVYGGGTSRPGELVSLSNYYPRALDSHANLGRILNEVEIDGSSFLMGDAGMAAFHSRLVALDHIGLGSAMIAHQGVTNAVLDTYNPRLLFLYARPESGVRTDYDQAIIQEWAETRGLNAFCDIYWQPNYSLRYFAQSATPEILDLCRQSEMKNNIGDRAYFISQVVLPPWHYWRE